MKPDPKLEMIGHNVVIDNGTATIKGGFSDSDNPKCRIPTIVGHGRHKVSGIKYFKIITFTTDIMFLLILIKSVDVMNDDVSKHLFHG